MEKPKLPSLNDDPAEAKRAVEREAAEPASESLSLEGLHGTVAVPHHETGFWRQWRAFRPGQGMGRRS